MTHCATHTRRLTSLLIARLCFSIWLLLLGITLQVTTPESATAQFLAPSNVTFSATAGGGPPAQQTIVLTPVAPQPTTPWTVSSNVSWISMSPTQGTVVDAQDEDLIRLNIDTSGLSAGIRTGIVTVTMYTPQGQEKTTSTIVTLNLTGSGGGGSTGPSIALSPSSLSYTGAAGGATPAAKTVSLTNPGGGTLSTSWTSSESWLVLSASSRTTRTETDTVNVTANTSGLSAGTYAGTVTVSGNAANSPQQIPVTLTVTGASGGGGASPVLSVNPSSLTFNVPTGQLDTVTQYLNITNTGGGSLSWSATDSAEWLRDYKTGSGTLEVNVDPAYFGGASGTHLTSLIITASGAGGSPKTVPVTLVIGSTTSTGGGSTPPPTSGGGGGTTPPPPPPPPPPSTTTPVLSVNPTSLTFNIPVGSQAISTQHLNVSNTGGGTLNWSATDNSDWLVDAKTSNGTLEVNVHPYVVGSAAGVYTANLTLSASGASGSPKTVPVTMVIGTGGGGGGGGSAASVTLMWNANNESDLQGYKVYYGTSSQNYTTNIDVGKVTSYTVQGLSTGKTYYFALKAVDTSGNESGFSDEASATR